jgi:hypothetical protein
LGWLKSFGCAGLRRRCGLFCGFTLLYCLFLSTIAHPLSAYTPPFSGKYVQGKCKYPYEKKGKWYAALKTQYGSDDAVLESINPGFLVDASGTLFYVTVDAGYYFGGKSYYFVKVLPNGTLSQTYREIDDILGVPGKWDGYAGPTSAAQAGTESFRTAWIPLSPCIANEVNGTGNFFNVLIYQTPASWWWLEAGSQGFSEGFLWCRFNKSDLSLSNSYYVTYGDTRANMAQGGLPRRGISANQLGCVALYQETANKVFVWWLNCFPPYWSSYSTNMYLCAATFSTTNNSLSSTIRCSGSSCVDYAYNLEPRVFMHGDYIYLLTMRNGYHPFISQISTSNGNVNTSYSASWGKCLHGSGDNATECCYHSDMAMVRASDGTNVFVVLMYSAGSRCNAMNDANAGPNRWNSNYTPWGDSNIVLHVQSSTNGSNWASGPENIIYHTNVSMGNASIATTTSSATLYKSTHKLVVYNNYIIYAYCYPGKTQQLILGVAHYGVDANHNVHLLTKVDFKDSGGNSFGNLTNCSRILFMDVKGSHLWITWMSTDNKTIYHFHINPQDLIDNAA